MITLTGTFKNIDNDTITVTFQRSSSSNITYNIGENSNSDIFFAADPVTINTECEDMFTTIMKKSCTVSLVTSMYLGDILFAENETSVTCQIYKNNTLVFDGYVEPNTYTQQYAHQFEQFDINCLDKLAVLQYKYITDTSSYEEIKSQDFDASFKYYIQNILGTNVYWDRSKYVGNNDIFTAAGVFVNLFLGETKDDMMNEEEILHEILQYCNLHIIQEGSYFVIFDWSTIINSTTSIFYNLFDNTTITIPTYAQSITASRYASDTTNLSMSEVYNQIKITCDYNGEETIIDSSLDNSDIYYYNRYPKFGSKFLREYISRTPDVIVSLIRDGANGALPDHSDEEWKIREWYFKWIYNPKWTLTFNNQDISNIAEYSGTQIINEWKLLKALKDNKFMPALLSVGKSKDITHKEHDEGIEINPSNYLVISVNGSEVDSQAALDSIDLSNKTAAHYQNNNSVTGLFTFNSDVAGIYSPTDEKSTNYIVFGGKMVLNPIMKISGWLSLSAPSAVAAQNRTFNEVYDKLVTHGDIYFPSGGTDVDDLGQYVQQFYKCTNTSQSLTETPDNNVNFLYPFTNDNQFKTYKYQYSVNGDDTDRVNILPVLLCEMSIGNKYLVQQNPNTDGEYAEYRWMTAAQASAAGLEKTFSLGFDPKYDDYIIGKEYELANTVDGRISSEKGTAVKITYDDKLSGRVQFKILGVIDTIWNDVTRKHKTMFRSESFQNHYKVLLEHVSSIWLKDFKVKIMSDLGGTSSNQEKDIVYVSDEVENYIKKRDDIKFKINTALPASELLELGIESNISKSNVLDMINGGYISIISDYGSNEHDRPERIYINQYWNLYNKPKPILNTVLKDTTTYPFWIMYTVSGFNGLVPLKVNRNLKYNTIDLTCRKIN